MICKTQANSLPQLHGVVILNKPQGLTSTRCLTALKKLGQKKIGHAGTLDPLASGVLLALLGQATKISSWLLEGGKTYSGVLRLGQTTDTWDSEGNILEEATWQHINLEDLTKEIHLWQELQEQPVPPFSAAKLHGQPLYKFARRGELVTRNKSIHISQATLLSVDLPFVNFRVSCSSGTYVRSLAHSLGKRLGCGAVLTQLTREYSHPFGLDSALEMQTLTEQPETLGKFVHPIHEALPSWPTLELTAFEAELVRHGQSVSVRGKFDPTQNERRILMREGRELALATLDQTGDGLRWKIVRGLWN